MAAHIDAAPLPDFPRVVYNRNPIIGVICQLRFPPILRIAAEPPVAFQEQIRTEYPLLAEKFPEPQIEFPVGVPPAVQEMFRSSIQKRKLIGYDFVAPDEKWRVTLTRDSLSLTSTKYERWEEFWKHLRGPLDALVKVYTPSFFIRVGLRYQDLIQRSNLGLPAATQWSELLNPSIGGLLAGTPLTDSVEATISQVELKLPFRSTRVRLVYGIAEAVSEPKEECFLIDSDFHTEERTAIGEHEGILRYFNRQSGRLFRWCIQDRLHDAMDPQTVQTSA
ncbi:MAG: TIGR04255 family protein [Bryobacteraceae bacterium]